jgi:hypothetical protein
LLRQIRQRPSLRDCAFTPLSTPQPNALAALLRCGVLSPQAGGRKPDNHGYFGGRAGATGKGAQNTESVAVAPQQIRTDPFLFSFVTD